MDEFESRLIGMIVEHASSDDVFDYTKATGMRAALELYSGPDRARVLLFNAGHEY